MNAYPPVADHGQIGEPQTAAPITSDGTIDTICSFRYVGAQFVDFPQAFSHLALISAAMDLDRRLDRGAGWADPVLQHRTTAHGG